MDSGTEDYKSFRPGIPTDQFGEAKIVYGDDEPLENTDTETGATEPETEASESLFSRRLLDQALKRSTDAEATASDNTGDSGGETVVSDIFAEDVSDLASQRKIVKRIDPDMTGIALPSGAPSMNVTVRFVITPRGLVSNVRVDDTGDSVLNARIEEALRQWKFVPISSDLRVPVRLLYEIRSDP